MAAQALSAVTLPTSASPSTGSRAAAAAAAAGRSVLPLPPDERRHQLLSSLLRDPLSLSARLPPRPVFRRRLGLAAVPTVLSTLPTANPERASSEKKPKWSARSIKSFGMAELEARKLKYPNTGTEALLMGILVEGTSQAAQFLRANGITLFKVREETVKLLGKSDLYFFSPEHPPLTEPAQKALDYAVDEKLKSGDSGEITTAHLLLGIWAQEDSAGHKILASLGFDNDKANELAKLADKDIVMNYR